MSQLPADLSRLSPVEKRALLAKLLQQKAREAAAPSSMEQRRPSLLDQFAVPVTELNPEVVLDPAIHPESLPVEGPTEPAHIFLTGATGFLGAFLLHELLQQTEATIYCLVRCANVEEGRRRIDRNLAAHLPGSDHHRGRIIPVVGDLSHPLLGLSPEQFEVLASQIDTIYHNGAAVNWIYSYSRLKSANVVGTQEILRLASRGTGKPVHVVSSLSVFPLVGNPQGKVFREPDSLDHGGVLYGGYTQSKWVAEKLATVARSRGLPVAIYRPGIITGHSQTGAWNTDDFMSRLIKSWIELGSAPDLDGATDMTPVDYVSSAMVHLSLSKQALGKVFHLVNPQRIHLRELVAWIRSSGYPIQHLPYDEWRTELLSRASRSKGQALYSLVPLFSARTPERPLRGGHHQLTPDGQNTVDQIGSIMAAQYAARSVKFDDQQTRDGLAGSSIRCPLVDGGVFARYLSYFVRAGFLHPPVLRDERQHAGRLS
jgi:thioester reductase-like protein